jgi:hypothetical protein
VSRFLQRASAFLKAEGFPPVDNAALSSLSPGWSFPLDVEFTSFFLTAPKSSKSSLPPTPALSNPPLESSFLNLTGLIDPRRFRDGSVESAIALLFRPASDGGEAVRIPARIFPEVADEVFVKLIVGRGLVCSSIARVYYCAGDGVEKVRYVPVGEHDSMGSARDEAVLSSLVWAPGG